MATKLFLAVSLLTCSRAIPANASVIKGVKVPNQINTTWISAQLNKITLLSSETMVCPSEILHSSQSCSGQHEQIYWEPSALCPCLAEPPASASWGDAELSHSCTVALAVLQLWFRKHLPKAMARSHCGIGMGHPFSCSCFFSFPSSPCYLWHAAKTVQ